jgi:hypothetical protein
MPGNCFGLTTQSKPPTATRGSTRQLAVATGVSASTIQPIWRAHGIKPHGVEISKVSREARFIEKLEDIVDSYLSPAEYGLCQ